MQKYRKQLIELTQALVNIPTENNPPNGYEKAGQEFMSSLYADMGLNVEMFSPCDLAEYETHEGFLRERNMKDRKDVVGVWKGKGNGKSIVLSGHMDVAPKEPLAWTQCQPYDSIVKNGRVYGRGSCDMKGGLVCSAVALRMLKDEGFVPSGDIIIESVVDEEYASGNGTLASRLKGYNADFAIVCEPTGERVCAANVGSILLNIRISGSAGMPYTGEKILNVAYALGDLLKIIEVLEEKRENDTAPPLWENAVQKRKFVITKVSAGETKPHGQLGCPNDAWIEVSVHTYPGEKVDDVIAEVTSFIKERFLYHADITITPLYNYVEPCNSDANGEAMCLLAESAAENGANGEVTIAPFPCDMFIFQKYADTQGAVFGPIGGNLHAPDEWVDIDSMMRTANTIASFIKKWCK